MDQATKTGSYYSAQEIDFRRTRKLHRHYIYLDAAEVINSLAGIELGQEEQKLRHTLKELGGNVGAKFAVAGVDVNLGGKKRSQLQEELRMKQTVHSAAGALLKRLEEDGGVAEVASAEHLPKVFETLTIKFDADLLPLERVAAPLPPLNWWDMKVQREKPEDRVAESREHELGGAHVVAYADLPYGDAPAGGKAARVGLQLEARYLMADYDTTFCRRATIVGQVMYSPKEHESIYCVPTIDGHQLRVTTGGKEPDKAPDATRSPALTNERDLPPRRKRGLLAWFKKSEASSVNDETSTNSTKPAPETKALVSSPAAAPASSNESSVAPTGDVALPTARDRAEEASPTPEEAAHTETDAAGGEPTVALVVKPLCIYK